ncbi:hypothetical protein AB0436_30490 [Streptomyces sp. NPDC051322]
MHRITVIGDGFTGPTEAVPAAEAAYEVIRRAAYGALGGGARTAESR